MKRCLIITITIFFVLSCKNEKTVTDYTFSDSFYVDSLIYSCLLEENIDLIGKTISDFQLLTDSTFLLVSRKNVYIYSKNGVQLGLVGKAGDGPHQYLSPDKIYVSEKYVYIWCRAQRKVFVYTKTGKYISEYSTESQSILTFSIYKDQFLCCLLEGTEEDKIIDIYDLQNLKSVKSIYSEDQQDRLLSLAQFSGGLVLSNDMLYWSVPSKLTLHALNLKKQDGKELIYGFQDRDFVVEKLTTDISALINDRKSEVLDFFRLNSRIIQIDYFENEFYIIAETGIIDRRIDGTFDYSNRKIKIYVLDENCKPINSYKLNYPLYCGLIKVIRGELYVLKADFSDNDFCVILEKHSIRCVK